MKILSSATVTPGRDISDKDLAAELGLSADDIKTRTGSSGRRYIAEGETGAGAVGKAMMEALGDLGKSTDDLGAIICSTVTPDHQFPGNSAFVQKELDLQGPAILDIRACDGGFLHTLTAAADFVSVGAFDLVAVGANDIFSTFLWHSETGAGQDEYFGDGAATWLIGPSDDDSGILSIEVGNDPTNVRAFWAESPGVYRRPRMDRELITSGAWHFTLDTKTLEAETRKHLPRIAELALGKAGVSAADIALAIPGTLHPAWGTDVATDLGVEAGSIATPHDGRGYFGTAMIPTAIDAALRSKSVAKGDLILALACGAGISFGAMVYRV